TEHHGVQVDAVFVDEAELGEAVREVRTGHLDLAVAPGLQLADRGFAVTREQRRVGSDGGAGAGGHPFRLPPPGRRKGPLVGAPLRLVVVPVAHDLVDAAAVDAARLPLRLGDEVAEEYGIGRELRVVDIAVERLVHSENELGHVDILSLRCCIRAISACSMQSVCGDVYSLGGWTAPAFGESGNLRARFKQFATAPGLGFRMLATTTSPSSRLLVAVLGAAALAGLWHVPAWLGCSTAAANDWLAGLQLAGPAIAAALGAGAAARSVGHERQAWSLIAAGSLLYILGNLAYINVALAGAGFPTWADLPFFIMALSFGGGIFLYGRRTTLPPAINTYNFILLYGAMIIGARFMLHHEIKASRLGEIGTVAAFVYPALWGSVAALAAVLLVLHPGGRRRLPLALLTVAMRAEAYAGVIYAGP